MANPLAGDVIKDTGGLRKMRFADERRGKGKRGGLRIIYFWWAANAQCWLFTLYDKDQADDLTPKQRNQLAQLLEHGLNPPQPAAIAVESDTVIILPPTEPEPEPAN